MKLNTKQKIALALAGFLLLALLALQVRETSILVTLPMFYVLFVLIVAIQLGTVAAMSAAFASFLAINFFLTRPYYTLHVADPHDVINLVVFLLVAVLCGQLGARAREQAREAQQRAQEQAILYRLTKAMNQANAVGEVHQALRHVLLEAFGARQVTILPAAATDPPHSAGAVHLLLLEAADRIYGTVAVTFDGAVTPPPQQLLMTCVGQAAMALQRIELAERARVGQQYQEADRLKTAILRAVSHDLRTPITIIKSAAGNLQQLGSRLTPAEQSEIAHGIEAQADHLNRLIGNLLDLSRLQAGALKLNCEPNALEEVAGDIAARIWQAGGEERVQVQFTDDMPLVAFDYGLILQALSNLTENALRYEPPDSQIQIAGAVEGEWAIVRVINHGPAIAPAARDQIMEPFVQGEQGGHVGLGLAVAKGIAEAHQGELRLEQPPGGGASFALRLPLTRAGVGQ